MKKIINNALQVSKRKYSAIWGMFIALSLTGCTRNFEEYNTNPTELTSAQSGYAAISAITGMEHSINDDYERAQDLGCNAFAGFLLETGFGAPNNEDYLMNDNWNRTIFIDEYPNVMGVANAIAKTTT